MTSTDQLLSWLKAGARTTREVNDMSATIDPVQAMISRLNERDNVTRADVAALLDALIEKKLSEYVRELQQLDVSPGEIKISMEVQDEVAREWKADVLREVSETFFSNARTTQWVLAYDACAPPQTSMAKREP
jgi:uncharacterized protein YhaN